MQLLAGIADALGEARFDVHVHVLMGDRPFEFAALDLGADIGQAAYYAVELRLCEHADTV